MKEQNTTSVKRTISETTNALITAKCEIQDLHCHLLSLMECVWGESDSDKCNKEIYERLIDINDYIDKALVMSINENIGSLSSTEI